MTKVLKNFLDSLILNVNKFYSTLISIVNFKIELPFSECNCNVDGSIDASCNENGLCSCKTNIVGEKCDVCAEGVNDFPNCDKCAENWFSENEHEEHHEGDHTYLFVVMV